MLGMGRAPASGGGGPFYCNRRREGPTTPKRARRATTRRGGFGRARDRVGSYPGPGCGPTLPIVITRDRARRAGRLGAPVGPYTGVLRAFFTGITMGCGRRRLPDPVTRAGRRVPAPTGPTGRGEPPTRLGVSSPTRWARVAVTVVGSIPAGRFAGVDGSTAVRRGRIPRPPGAVRVLGRGVDGRDRGAGRRDRVVTLGAGGAGSRPPEGAAPVHCNRKGPWARRTVGEGAPGMGRPFLG